MNHTEFGLNTSTVTHNFTIIYFYNYYFNDSFKITQTKIVYLDNIGVEVKPSVINMYILWYSVKTPVLQYYSSS